MEKEGTEEDSVECKAEFCAYCNISLDPFGHLFAFIDSEGCYRRFCDDECYRKYEEKYKENG